VEEDRVALYAELSPEARAGWDRFCDSHGLSLTSVLEVVGLRMATDEETFHVDEEKLTPLTREVVRAARQLQNERRKRRPD
jgi:hypothetical protein